jgi:hypothetical protein
MFYKPLVQEKEPGNQEKEPDISNNNNNRPN